MERIISNDFVKDLEDGVLRNILKYVKSDTTLAMEIRKKCVNIYYRGGSLLKIREVGDGLYNAYFDKNYISSDNSKSVLVECIPNIGSPSKVSKLIDYIPKIKQQMDIWMKLEMPGGGEREYKHIVAKENNYGNMGKGSDYFIGDIEYRGDYSSYLFDMIGMKWSVNCTAHDNLDLALFNMYYGENNLKSIEAILSSIELINEFLSNKEALDSLKADLTEIYAIKSSLGLLYPYKEVEIGFSDKIELIYIFGNQNGKAFKNLLEMIRDSKEYSELSKIANIKIATASFMGYGLYEKNMIDIEEAIEKL